MHRIPASILFAALVTTACLRAQDTVAAWPAPEKLRAPAACPAPAPICALTPTLDPASRARAAAPGRPMRPPDDIARLRSVILLT